MALPFAKTEYCLAITGAVGSHGWMVTHLSPFLDILGMPVFMDAKNGIISYRGGVWPRV